MRTAGSQHRAAHSDCIYEGWIPCAVLKRVGTIPLPAPVPRERYAYAVAFNFLHTPSGHTPMLKHPTASPLRIHMAHCWRRNAQRSAEGGGSRGCKQLDVHFGGKRCFCFFLNRYRWAQHLSLSFSVAAHTVIAINHGSASHWSLSCLAKPPLLPPNRGFFLQLPLKTSPPPPPLPLLSICSIRPSIFRANLLGDRLPWTWYYHCVDMQLVVAKRYRGAHKSRK